MNGNTALDLILARVGRQVNAGIRASALFELQQVQEEYEQGPNLPWFLFQTKTAAITTGDSDVALPAGFIRFDEDEGLVYLGTIPRLFLEVADMPRLQSQEPTIATPRACAVLDKLYFFPTADQDYTLNVYAAYADALPADSATTNLWLTNAPYLLVAKTAWRLATTHLQDFELAAQLQQDVAIAERRLSGFTAARRFARQEQVKGDYDA